MSLDIRKATFEDLQTLAEMLSQSWLSAYRCIIPMDELEKHASVERRYRKLKEMYSASEYNLYIAFYEHVPCGEIMSRQSRDSDINDYGEIVSIYLLEEYWDMGLGKELMSFTCKTMKADNYKNIFLWVFKDNQRARRFYEKFGFVADGTEKASTFSNGAIEVRYRLKSS